VTVTTHRASGNLKRVRGGASLLRLRTAFRSIHRVPFPIPIGKSECAARLHDGPAKGTNLVLNFCVLRDNFSALGVSKRSTFLSGFGTERGQH
jgi:hypothetical protein